MPEARGHGRRAGVGDNKVTRMAEQAGVGDNKVTRMAKKAGVGGNKVKYYYFVSLVYPFREQSLEDAEKEMDDAFPKQPVGEFKLLRSSAKELFFAFNFKNSEAANKAKSINFVAVRKNEVDTERILPRETVSYFRVTELSFMLIAENDYDVAIKAGIKAGIEAGVKAGIEAATTTPSVEAATVVEQLVSKSEVAERLEEGAIARKIPRQIPLPELARNAVLRSALTTKLQDLGFECEVSGNTPLSHAPLSKYFNSRPDLVIYHRHKLLAATAVIDSDTSDEEDTLMGAVTENKLSSSSGDVEAQLLAEMEKVAGELVSKYFQKQGEVKAINKIEIYGLIITFPDTCRVRMLQMDFVSKSSCVHLGSESLTVTDGFNRLVTQLKSRVQDK